MHMPNLRILPDALTSPAGDEDTILDVALRHQIEHAHACGGHARCSTCRVEVLEGLDQLEAPNAAEKLLAERLHLPPYVRLACQAKMRKHSGESSVRRLVITKGELDHVLKSDGDDKLRQIGSQQRISILFADIRGFTTLSERAMPYDIVHGLNFYFHHMGAVIERNGGTINAYMGDGLMALFGVDGEDCGAQSAVKSALEMEAKVEELSEQFESLFGQPIHIGVGVHTGEVVLGYIGSTQSGAVTVIGDAVNTASRIESATKELGVSVLVSQAVLNQLGDAVELGAKDSISLKGKSGSYDVFEVKRIL